MTIKEFIEAAIEGGWKSELTLDVKDYCVAVLDDKNHLNSWIMFQSIVLDPEAWEAVFEQKKLKADTYVDNLIWVEQKMHNMINALCHGKNLEEYIATL